MTNHLTKKCHYNPIIHSSWPQLSNRAVKFSSLFKLVYRVFYQLTDLQQSLLLRMHTATVERKFSLLTGRNLHLLWPMENFANRIITISCSFQKYSSNVFYTFFCWEKNAEKNLLCSLSGKGQMCEKKVALLKWDQGLWGEKLTLKITL